MKKTSKRPDAAADQASLVRDVARLRATVDRLEQKLAKQEKKTAKWKGEAKAERTRAAKLDAALRRASQERPRDHDGDSGDVPVDPPVGTATPDATWTVPQLRAAARREGVVGTSRMTKAELLTALQGLVPAS